MTTPLSLGEIAERIGAKLENAEAASIVIRGAAPIHTAVAGEISFLANEKYKKFLASTQASAIILDTKTESTHPAILRDDNPYLAFAFALDALYPPKPLIPAGVHPTAVVEPGAQIDPTAAIGALCHIRTGSTIGENCQLVSSVFIGCDCTIGDDSLLYPGVRVMDSCKIGKRAIIHSSTVIGSDGFGFAPSPQGAKKVLQIGWVEIGDDVEIGSNCSIDRGALGPTRIGNRTKIDNLVQIAHNVEIGDDCFIVSQVGIAGSTKVGNRCVLAGQVGLVGHIEIGDGSIIGAQSGVSKTVPGGKTWFGSPAREIMESKRIEAALSRLPELLKRVKRLEGGRDDD
jgi:UDP-3-O-[3-hydroxymyristoyl] glucosamine N-acyltransferase